MMMHDSDRVGGVLCAEFCLSASNWLALPPKPSYDDADSGRAGYCAQHNRPHDHQEDFFPREALSCDVDVL